MNVSITSNGVYEYYTVINNEVIIKEDHFKLIGMLLLVGRILFTILIEILVLALLVYRKKESFKIVTLTNVVTQFILSVLLYIVYYFNGIFFYLGALILGELLVIVIETVVYAKLLDEHTKGRAIIYAILANLATIFIGLII